MNYIYAFIIAKRLIIGKFKIKYPSFLGRGILNRFLFSDFFAGEED